MTRRGAPALYELMRRPGSTGPTAEPGTSRRVGNAPGLPSSFEVSLARAAIIGAVVVVAIAVAYGIGVQRGASRARSDAGSAGVEPAAGVSNGAPVRDGGIAIPPLGKPSGNGASPKTASAGSAPAAPRPATDNNGDPRVKGTRYYVLAHPSSDRAAEMLSFCRSNGLDAYLVPDDNALLRKIIVLPGYRNSAEKSSPEVKDLESRIKTVGDKWKRAARGNKDFAEAYAELCR